MLTMSNAQHPMLTPWLHTNILRRASTASHCTTSEHCCHEKRSQKDRSRCRKEKGIWEPGFKQPKLYSVIPRLRFRFIGDLAEVSTVVSDGSCDPLPAWICRGFGRGKLGFEGDATEERGRWRKGDHESVTEERGGGEVGVVRMVTRGA
jgi:hypothetical protein